jgi:hypothetical protein
MASSKDVLAVVGMMVVNSRFRAEFLNNPEDAAADLVGKLRQDEVIQIRNVAGKRDLPAGQTRQQYLAAVNTACEALAQASGCSCPSPPCPDPPCPNTDEF